MCPSKTPSRVKKAVANPLADQMAADAAKDEKDLLAGGTKALKTITDLASQIRNLDNMIEDLEAAIRTRKDERFKLATQDLPNVMTSVGLKSFVTSNGLKIELKPEVAVSISDDKAAFALDWLRKNKFGDIIKSQVAFAFGKGEDKLQKVLVTFAKKQKLPFSMKAGVHPQTLKAFAREQIEQGRTLPAEGFNVFDYTIAKIAPTKEAKIGLVK